MPNTCRCGCGEEVAEGKQWLRGHHKRGEGGFHGDISSPETKTLKVCIYPSFGENDEGDGGIRRVVEAQLEHLPAYGIEVTKSHEEADVILCHATMPPPWYNLYPRKPIIAFCHGLYWSEYEWENWAIKANADVMSLLRTADSIITCSEWVANAIRRHLSRDVAVINHGVDAEYWKTDPKQNRGYVLWNKTRPDPVCDPEPVNQVAELLPTVNFVTTFGEEKDNVIVTGRVSFDDAKKVIQGAGVYLCTARETFGIGTLEALAAGIPVVGYRFGGQAEFIEHGVDGWLATPGDIQGLADGVRWALDNRQTASVAAIRKAKQFTWGEAASKYSDVIHKVYAEKQKQGVPRTSVIITAYNLDKYLPDAITSVINQTDDDWELIVVDDASPDRCGEIAESYRTGSMASKIRVIRNAKNEYLSEARNIGIRAARGRYILPLDADDMLDPNAVAILADALDADRKIHVAYGSVRFTEEDGVTLKNYGRQYEPGHSGWPYQFTHEQQIMQRNLLPYSSMFRKTAWKQTGGYRRRCNTAEDADFWTRLSSYGFRPKMVTEQDTLIYRVREDSMSQKQGTADWVRWFSWAKLPEITPAGAGTQNQLAIPSLDPIIISVIIPVGPGHEKIFTDAVDSVDTQSFRNWECVVVNDSGKPLVSELPTWVKVINTEGRTGPAHARNVGIRAAKGRLFLPLDADDYLEPDALQFMYDAYQETKDVIYSDFWEDPYEAGKLVVYNCPDYDANLLKQKGAIHTVTALTPKVHWEKVGGYDEDLSAWEDWDLQLKFADVGICSTRVPAPLFVYRKHTGFRRTENVEFFERSKQDILRKWGDLWEGRKVLMACGSCGRGKSSSVNLSQNSFWSQAKQAQIPAGQNAVKVLCTNGKLGAISYKGISDTIYHFADGDIKYVLEMDLDVFRRFPNDFRIVEEQIPQADPSAAPVLVANGPPATS